jgi:hypothetical protein
MERIIMNAVSTSRNINLNAATPHKGFHRAVALNVTARPVRADGSDPLKQAIQAALDTVNPTMLIPVSRNNAVAFHPRTMLAAIIVCYVHQIYGSTEIERHLRNTDVRLIGAGTWPDARLIREFRCHNCQTIHDCLMTALRLVGLQKVRDGTVTKISEAQFAVEANRRLVMAMFTDCMELGKG